MADKGGKSCPICTEEMDLTDQQLKPCKCGYEVQTSLFTDIWIYCHENLLLLVLFLNFLLNTLVLIVAQYLCFIHHPFCENGKLGLKLNSMAFH